MQDRERWHQGQWPAQRIWVLGVRGCGLEQLLRPQLYVAWTGGQPLPLMAQLWLCLARSSPVLRCSWIPQAHCQVLLLLLLLLV